MENLGGSAAVDRLASPGTNTSPKPAVSNNDRGQEASGVNDPVPDDSDPKYQYKRETHEELGRLVIDEGRSRYVSNRFWASIGDSVGSIPPVRVSVNRIPLMARQQIEELQDILDYSSENEGDYPSPGSSEISGNQNHEAFLFGYHSVAKTLRNYHPTPTQGFILYKTYQENVAVLVKVTHEPTVRHLVVEAASDLASLDKNTEAFLFSMYLSAVISMSPQECLSELGEERDATIKRFRFATEQALARANLLNSQNTTLLQAAVLFLSCIRNQDESRFVWTLSAVVLRLATGLGLHRDGSNFGLKPLEAEIRRRIWWHICVLDLRSAEDHGTDPMINDAMYDTHFPSNIQDEDLTPDSVAPPPERIGCTDMTFSLIRCEVTLAYRQLTYIPPGNSMTPPKMEDREKLIEKLIARFDERYVRHCDMKVPLQWVCAMVARLIVAKLWLIVHHPMARAGNAPVTSHDDRNRLLLTSIEIIEFSHLLERNENTARWNWLFSTYIQWHAVAFVLAELCVRPLCPGVDRAWLAVTSVFHEWERQATQKKKGMLWRPLAKLMKRATEFRKTQQDELRAKWGPNRPIFQPEPSPILNTGVATIMGLPQPELITTPEKGSYPDPHTQASSVLPAPATSQQVQSPPQTESNLDLNKQMPETLNDMFPSYYYVEPMMITSMDTNPYVSNTTADMMNTTIAPAPRENSSYGLGVALNWDQFDDVMRDFQLDIEQNNGLSVMGHMMDVL